SRDPAVCPIVRQRPSVEGRLHWGFVASRLTFSRGRPASTRRMSELPPRWVMRIRERLGGKHATPVVGGRGGKRVFEVSVRAGSVAPRRTPTCPRGRSPP